MDPALPTVIYDQNGQQAYWASRILAGSGFASVAALSGGYVVWLAQQAAAAR